MFWLYSTRSIVGCLHKVYFYVKTAPKIGKIFYLERDFLINFENSCVEVLEIL